MEQSLKKIIRVLLDSIVLLIILALIVGFNPLEINKNILSIAHLVEYENIDGKIPILVLVIIVSITIFTASLIINRKVQVNTFRKSLEGLLPPILAEAVLDGKVSVRNLIMTSIVDLCVRGNIRIINNDILELVSLRDLEEYELSIVHLLFVKRVVRISDMNEIFAKSNVETLSFSYKLRKIRNLIVKRLFDLNIYSESLSKSNAIIRICAFILALNTPLLLQSDYNLCFALALINISIITIFIRGTQNQTSFREEWILGLPKGRRRKTRQFRSTICSIVFYVCSFSTARNLSSLLRSCYNTYCGC